MFKKITTGTIAALMLAAGLTMTAPNSAQAALKIFVGNPHVGFFIGNPNRCWRHRHGGGLHHHCGRGHVIKVVKPKHCHWRGRGILRARFCHRH